MSFIIFSLVRLKPVGRFPDVSSGLQPFLARRERLIADVSVALWLNDALSYSRVELMSMPIDAETKNP